MHTATRFLATGLLVYGALHGLAAQASAACTASFSVENSWNGGYIGMILVTHNGATNLDGWTLDFNLPTGHTIDSLWDGLHTQDGTAVRVVNVDYNAALPVGSSVSVGFVVVDGGNFAEPSGFALEGAACSGPLTDFDEGAFLLTPAYWTYGVPYFSYLARRANAAGGFTPELLAEVALLEQNFGSPRPGSPFTAPAPTPPTPPQQLTAEIQGIDRVWLRWQDESPDEDGFHVERREREGDWQDLVTLDADATSFVDAALAGPLLYHYRVGAFNQAGLSEPSSSVSIGIGLREEGAALYDALACSACHGSDGLGGATGVGLARLSDPITLAQKITIDMPLGNPASCDAACAASLSEFILADLLPPQLDCSGVALPPRQLRLLTRREYSNTIEDLLGLETGVTANFPVEVRVGGYDNNAAAAVVTTRHVDEHLAAAQELALRAVAENRGAVLPCDPATGAAACAERFVREFGHRAYRRALGEGEVQRLLALFGTDPESDFDADLEAALTSLLVSPHFLYRHEIGIPYDDLRARLEPWELASQLSYLSWGSMPDAELLDAAENGGLETESQWLAQAERLLEDPRARRQLGTFFAQWLDADPVMAGNKDQGAFPGFDTDVREAQFEELERFAAHVFFDSSARFDELFEADYVMANDTLADFYGLAHNTGADFEPVPVPDGHRGGILTLGSVLASHAHADDSSPVRRGVFVRERLLCQELPPPPPDVDNTPPGLDPTLTTRERFTLHSSDPSCQSCHQFIDGVGFGFQRFDAVGSFRTDENGLPVDSTGTVIGLEDREPGSAVDFDGLSQLASILASSRAAKSCLPAQLERYASGREEDEALACEIATLASRFESSGGDLHELLLDLVRLPSFRYRSLAQ